MKTKFFKKLSLVLVVAMVLSLFVPAVGAFAASSVKLNATKKYLHLGRDDANEFNFNIKSEKKTGWKYFWESSNEDVAEVNSKNGVVTATGVGTAKITVTITDKDKELVDKATATVVVRDNIEDLSISNPVEKLAVGAEHDYNRGFVTESGSKKKTSSIVRWEVSPAEGATIDDKGVFVATAAGEYTVIARAFQSKAKYADWLSDAEKYASYVLDTAETKVVVNASMVEAKQVDGNTVKVTFDSAVADAKDKLTVHQLVGTAKVKQLVKEVKMSDDNKVATVTMYVDFTPEATYFVSYPDMEDESFVAARRKVEDVASIKIDTTKAVIDNVTDIDVVLLNAEGVDITTPDLSSRVSIEGEDVVGSYVDETAKTIIIFEKDIAVKVTATFHTLKYDDEGNEIGNLTAASVILGVEEDPVNVTGLKAWTIVDKSKDPVFTDVNHKLSADDTDLRLYVQYSTKKGNTTKDVDSKTNQADFAFESSDENVLIIDATTGVLHPIKAGSVVVVVKYGADGATKKPIDAIPVKIDAEAKAQNMVLTPNSFSLSNAENLGDSKDVKLKVTDQLGREMGISGIDVQRLNGPSTHEVTKVVDVTNKKVTFIGDGVEPGVYSYQITATDSNNNEIKRTVQITIQKSNHTEANPVTPNKHVLEISDSKVDVKAVSSNTNEIKKGVTIKLFGLKDGIKVEKKEFSETATTGSIKLDIVAPKSAWNATSAALTSDVFTLLYVDDDDNIVKAPVGTYKVTAYEYKKVGSDYSWVAIDYKYFAVEDTQTKPVVTNIKTLVVDANMIDRDTPNKMKDLVIKCFEVKLDGVELTKDEIVEVYHDGTNSAVNIKKVKYKVTFNNKGNPAYLEFEVDINRTVKAK